MSDTSQLFNIRVYGVLINDQHEVLLSTEERKGMRFTKFPGGGLEWGEGIQDCLRREIKEELGIECEINELFYLTEHFQESAFRKGDQLISVYYRIDSTEIQNIRDGFESLDPKEPDNHFYWYPIDELKDSDLTFPIDKLVADRLKSVYAPKLKS